MVFIGPAMAADNNAAGDDKTYRLFASSDAM